MQLPCQLPEEREQTGAFAGQVDIWVREAIGSRHRPTFAGLLKTLPGVYPTEVLLSLRRLNSLRIISDDYLGLLMAEAETPIVSTGREAVQGAVGGFCDLGQLEHPLDFEWRFSKPALEAILVTISSLYRRKRANVLCLGCPSVFAFGRKHSPEHTFLLWDKNAGAMGQLAETQFLASVDLVHDDAPPLSADLAVLDPPWYNDYYKLFIWTALRTLRPGGRIILSFPPVGTRPSAESDWAEVLGWSQECGLLLESVSKAALPYRTPLFEINALKVTGLHGAPLDWRRGNLVVLRLNTPMQQPRPRQPDGTARWQEYRFGMVRFKVRTDVVGTAPTLGPTGESEVLASVSSRHPHRLGANLVTSGNRFMQSAFPERLAFHCRELGETFAAQRGEDSETDPIRHELLRLIGLEQAEARQYLAAFNDH